jgi:hypothetical protein
MICSAITESIPSAGCLARTASSKQRVLCFAEAPARVQVPKMGHRAFALSAQVGHTGIVHMLLDGGEAIGSC